MKKISSIIILIVAVLFTSCGPHTYSAMSAGQADQSYVVVVTGGEKYKNITVDVDGVAHRVEKVYKVKHTRKAHPIIISPGKHTVKVINNGQVIFEENVFLGVQQTKKITLQ